MASNYAQLVVSSLAKSDGHNSARMSRLSWPRKGSQTQLGMWISLEKGASWQAAFIYLNTGK